MSFPGGFNMISTTYRGLLPTLVACLLSASLAFGPEPTHGAATSATPRSTTLVIGRVSDNPKKHYERLKPMLDYALERMRDLGVTEGRVLFAKDNDQLVRYVRQGKIDWVTETAFAAVLLQDRAGAEILLRKWKKGVPHYHTVFFALKGSGIGSLDDLAGRVIAFEDRGSTSAYLVPSSVLVRHGMEIVQLDSPRDRAPSDLVGFVFSGEELNTSTWVHKGLVDAGAFSNLDWDSSELPVAFREQMQIFHETRPLPRALELVRSGLDPRVKERLKEILLATVEDPAAQDVLMAYEETTRFDEPNGDIMAALDEIRSMRRVVRTALE